ncbi:MAG: hypothetical protein HYY44_06405 [Deltaproteobacteria bacterium]|nr:hypothetical protein [Deltaproteobacteria bacterium]
MKILIKVVFFLTLFGLVLVALNVEFIPKRKRVLACDPSDLVGFKMVAPGSVFSLDPVDKATAREGDWSVVSGSLRGRAEKKTVQTYRRLVCFIPWVEKFPLKPDEGLGIFGLEQPDRLLTVIGKETLLLSLGDDAPSGTEFYLTP